MIGDPVTAVEEIKTLRAEVDRLRTEVYRLHEHLRGVGANRYWEGRWRDADAEVERLRTMLCDCGAHSNPLGVM